MKSVIQNWDGTQTVIAQHGADLITGTVQDCTPILEYAKAVHNHGYTGPSREMKWAGRIPYVIIEKYCNDNGITFREYMGNREHARRLLNDPALADFRIWKGQV